MKEFSLSGGIGVDLNIKDFKEMLDSAGGDEINLSFSSVGGYVFDGFEIYNLIKDYKGKKSVTLNGITASIASYIAMAFDNITVRDNTPFMIHNAFGGIFGDYKDMQAYGEHLKNLTDLIANKYVEKTGKSKKEILALMDKETWLYGSEIVDENFANILKKSESDDTREAAIHKASLIFNSFKPPAKKDDLQRAVALMADENKLEDNFDEAKSLIESNKFDAVTKSEDEKLIQNGVVMRSVLRRMISHANVNNKSQIAELISMIDKRQNKGARKVETKEDALNLLKNMKTNGDVTLVEIAKYIGLEKQVITTEHIQALEMINELGKLGIKNASEVKALQDLVHDTEEDRINQKLINEFDPDGVGEKNKLLTYAKKILGNGNVAENKLDEEIKKFKEDPLAKDFAAQLADYTSEVNTITTTEKKSGDFLKSTTIEL